MAKNCVNKEFALTYKPDDCFQYRKHSCDSSANKEKSFPVLVLFYNCRRYSQMTLKIKSNLLIIDKLNIKLNLINLYVKSLSSKSAELIQKNFKLNVFFRNGEDLRRFMDCCGNLVIHKGIWLDYVRLKKLDEGAFSKVYLARKAGSYDSLFAVKRIKKGGLDKRSFRYFNMELFALRNISHRNALTLHKVYEDEDYFYLITEYLNGGTLIKKMKSKRVREDLCVKVVRALLGVIIELNKYDLVHRDIKPTNIMFTCDSKGNEVCKLIDFGLCADYTDHSENTLLKDKSGTVCYLAPELIGWDVINKLYDEKVDVFSIGMILYEM